jgi:hypothetical protein
MLSSWPITSPMTAMSTSRYAEQNETFARVFELVGLDSYLRLETAATSIDHSAKHPDISSAAPHTAPSPTDGRAT